MYSVYYAIDTAWYRSDIVYKNDVMPVKLQNLQQGICWASTIQSKVLY